MTTRGWDFSRGNLTSVTKPTVSGGTVTTTATYEGGCNLCTSVTDPLGRQATATVDPVLKAITATTTPRSHVTSYGYDAATGDVTSMQYPLGAPRYLSWSYAGKLMMVSDGSTMRASNTYDSAGRRLTATDGNNRTVEYTWDAMDRLRTIRRTLNGQPVVTTLEYDPNGNRTALIDPEGRRWEWVFDDLDRVVEKRSPLPGTPAIRSEYDLNSNLRFRTDRMGQKWEWRYGVGDRLELRAFFKSNGAVESTATYTYNATTKLLSSVTDTGMASSNNVISWGYDSLDRIISETRPLGAGTETLTFTLDDLGRRTALQVPGQGLITYGFDNNDNITSITQDAKTTSLEFDSMDRLIRRTVPTVPAVTTEWTRNWLHELSQMRSLRGGVQFDNRLYGRDNTGALINETINGVLTTYGYDGLNRLVSTTGGGGPNLSWTYDKVGNRLTQTVGGVTTTYTHNAANHLLTVNGAPVTSDANGSVTAFGTDTYIWNVRNQLKALTRSTGTHQFRYDFNGLRVKRWFGTTTIEYLLHGDSVVKESNNGVATNVLHSPFTDQPLARGGKWFVPDKLGSTALLLNGDSTLAQGYSYKPFGELAAPVTDNNPFQFTGRENDGTGLMYYRARYYAPEWGRFLSEDPLGFPDGPNQFAYLNNSPVNGRDPSGQFSLGELLNILSYVPEVIGEFFFPPSEVQPGTPTLGNVPTDPSGTGLGTDRQIAVREGGAEACDYFQQTGGDILTGGIPVVGATRRIVVIGESMDRVRDLANTIGATTYRPRKWITPQDNRRWAQAIKRQGCTVVDYGTDPSRTDRSLHYAEEADVFAGYPGLIPVDNDW